MAAKLAQALSNTAAKAALAPGERQESVTAQIGAPLIRQSLHAASHSGRFDAKAGTDERYACPALCCDHPVCAAHGMQANPVQSCCCASEHVSASSSRNASQH